LSTIKSDAVTASTGTNQNLDLSGKGTGGVKISDYLIQTKGDDIASATSLTLGKDGNQFDVTGTTTITSIATQGIGSIVTLHFDGVLTFTHHSTDLILPGAASITTAAGDIAVMYEYASADWRCVSYTKASGAAVVAATAGFTLATEQATTSGTAITFGSIPTGTKMIVVGFKAVSTDGTAGFEIEIGDSGGLETAGYLGGSGKLTIPAQYAQSRTDAWIFHPQPVAANTNSGTLILTLEDSSDFTWTITGTFCSSDISTGGGGACYVAGSKSLSAELTQISITGAGDDFDAGVANIMYM